MALQDLTPQLRTRLNRMERAVGWFVLLATALLVFGFGYYLRNTAKRKGWFLTKAPYFTFTDRAAGLKAGDPVLLMGLEVGRITEIKPMPPYEPYEIYVQFELKDPFYGYIWSEGSRAHVVTADLLGKRVLEVTKGIQGVPSYIFSPLRDVALKEVATLPQPEHWRLAEDVYATNGLDLILPALSHLTNLNLIASVGRSTIRVLDTHPERQKKFFTGVWRDKAGRYDFHTKTNKPYWLRSDETPAITDRLEKLVAQVEVALPNILSLTNQISRVLANSSELTSNLNVVALNAQPASANLAALSAQLRAPGALGEWALGTNVQRQLEATLESANTTLSHTDTNLTGLVENLARSLDNLAEITSNLNAQVQANTNILSGISSAVVDVDDLVQGLKRHWLLRSAFKVKATNAPPAQPSSPQRRLSPRDSAPH